MRKDDFEMIVKYDEETIKLSPYTHVINIDNFKPHVHSFWEIGYTLLGDKVLQYVNEKKADLDGGHFIIIKPGDIHRISRKNGDKRMRRRDIFISDYQMRSVCNILDKGLYEKLLYTSKPIIVPISQYSVELLELRYSVFSHREKFAKEQLDAIQLSLLGYLLGLYVESEVVLSEEQPKWFSTLVENLKNPEFITQSIEDIIKTTNYSHGFVCRKFKNYTGNTLVGYILSERLNKSLVLLMDKNKLAVDIAYECGFCSQSSYINAFKKVFGVTPAVWRKNNVTGRGNSD